jgi:hypothetical protein
LDTFSSRQDTEEGAMSKVVVDKLFDIRYTTKIENVYTKVVMGDTDEDDVAVDALGYTGNYHFKDKEE